MALGKIELHISESDETDQDDEIVAYVSLPTHPGTGIPGIVKKQTRLRDLVGDHGPMDVYLDFDASGQLIGIEILG